MVTGISSHVYELLKPCLKQVPQESAVTLHDLRRQDVLEIRDGQVNHRAGDLRHLLSDGVIGLLDGVRPSPEHPVL